MPFFKSKKANQPQAAGDQGQPQSARFPADGNQTGFAPQTMKCPNCGAPLNITDGNAEYVTCNYCQTAVQVRQDPAPAANSPSFGDLGVNIQSAVASALSGLNVCGSKMNIIMGTPSVRMTVNGIPVNNGSILQVNGAALNQADFQRDLAAGRISQEAADIRQTGVSTKGVILSCTPTGNIVDGESELTLHVKVTRPDGSAYEVAVTKHVPQNGLAYTVPGSVIHVFYKPGDEQNIFIGFHA